MNIHLNPLLLHLIHQFPHIVQVLLNMALQYIILQTRPRISPDQPIIRVHSHRNLVSLHVPDQVRRCFHIPNFARRSQNCNCGVRVRHDSVFNHSSEFQESFFSVFCSGGESEEDGVVAFGVEQEAELLNCVP